MEHLGSLIKMQIPGPTLTDTWVTRSGMNPGICILIKPTRWIRWSIKFILNTSFLTHLSWGQIFSAFQMFQWTTSDKWAYASSKGTFISLRVEGLVMLLYEMTVMLNLGDIEKFFSQRLIHLTRNMPPKLYMNLNSYTCAHSLGSLSTNEKSDIIDLCMF